MTPAGADLDPSSCFESLFSQVVPGRGVRAWGRPLRKTRRRPVGLKTPGVPEVPFSRPPPVSDRQALAHPSPRTSEATVFSWGYFLRALGKEPVPRQMWGRNKKKENWFPGEGELSEAEECLLGPGPIKCFWIFRPSPVLPLQKKF